MNKTLIALALLISLSLATEPMTKCMRDMITCVGELEEVIHSAYVKEITTHELLEKLGRISSTTLQRAVKTCDLQTSTTTFSESWTPEWCDAWTHEIANSVFDLSSLLT